VNHAHCKAWQGLPPKDVAAAYLQALALAPEDRQILHKAYTYTPAAERAAAMQKLVDERPKDVWRLIYLAHAQMGAKEHAKAFDALELASRLAPEDPYVALDEGKDLDKAIDFYCEAISLFKARGGVDQSVYQRLAGPVAFEHKALSAAQRDKLWSHLWKAAPDRYDAMNNAGLWYRDLGKDYERSLEWYLRAAAVATEDACVQNDTGLIYHYHFKEYRKAEPFYRNAVRIGREQGLAWDAPRPPGMGYRDGLNNLALILIAEKRWDDLRRYVTEEVPEDHASRDAWLRLAEEKK
jgi:tetratricopeptide (TPR) repeat protein